MDAVRNRFRWLGAALAAVLMITAVAVPTANAAMIGTQVMAQSQTAEEARDRIAALMEREDVRAEMVALGVDPAQAEQRVAALTDTEARQLAARMDEMPAGGSVVGALVLIFLVLLFTDLMGWTDVYPFVKKTAR